MTHELKKIIAAYLIHKKNKGRSVLATVVDLKGSSYRRPGVRMLIHENGEMVGAVSGGCVEKEILRQATTVFKSNIAKVMTYDGRYKLGCEGTLFILIESFSPSEAFITAFEQAIASRTTIAITSYYANEVSENTSFGSSFKLNTNWHPINHKGNYDTELTAFSQVLKPCCRLLIIGAEHDAVELCAFASQMGWEVLIIAPPTQEKKLADFNGALRIDNVVAEEIDVSQIDKQTAVVLMTHSYAKDLHFLIALQNSKPGYLGLLGPNTRREKLLNEFVTHCPEVEERFFDFVYGPAGLNIGAETPQEIAIAILAEILTVFRDKKPISLRDKNAGIHT